MGRRIVTVTSPGAAGMLPDVEPHLLSPQQAVLVRDGIVLDRGVVWQRRGWNYWASTGAGAVDLLDLEAEDFLLAGVSRMLSTKVASSRGTGVRLDPTTGDDTNIFAAEIADSAEYLWRCVYNDQAVACSQGNLPARFYSGSAVPDFLSTATTVTYTSGKATATIASATNAAVDRGTYLLLNTLDSGGDDGATVCVRVLERISSTVLTLEDIKASASGAANSVDLAYACGYSFPCVSVYEAGTGTTSESADTFTGTGTKWSTGSWGSVIPGQIGDGLLRIVPSTGIGRMYQISAVNSDTELDVVNSADVADCKYHIARRFPVKDADNWRGTLVGAGVDQHKNRVYFWPPGANPALPPAFQPRSAVTGLSAPFDPAVQTAYSNPNDFLCDFIEVPARDDDDPIVAIRATPDHLLVYKERSLHVVVGSFPNYETDVLRKGVGCFDIRSAQAFQEGRFCCDHNGIYRESGLAVDNLADAAGFGTTWRRIADDFDLSQGDRCTLVVHQGHLLVSIDPRVEDPTTFVVDIRRPQNPILTSIWDNHRALAFMSKYLPSLGLDGLYWVGGDAPQGRVADSGPIFVGTSNALDADTNAPALTIHTGTGLARAAKIGVDARLTRTRIDANLHDSAGAASSLDYSIVDSQRWDDDSAPVTTVMAGISSKNYDGAVSHPRRYGRKGAQHQIRLEKNTTAATEVTTEVHGIVLDFRDREKPL